MRKTTRKLTTPRLVAANPIPEVLSSQVVTSQRVDKIFSALSKAQGEVEKATRSKEAADDETHKTWTYAGLDDVLDAVKEARASNGLAVIERFPAGKACLHALLIHESGHWIDYGTYAFGDYKTQNEKSEIVTRARRHFMKCIFGVVDEAEDVDERKVNSRHVIGENVDEPLQDDHGGRKLTDKEQREQYQIAKNKYLVDCPITEDGRRNYDIFVTNYEAALADVKTMTDLSMLGKANALVLNKMQEDRPDLFDYLQGVISPIAQKFL
jgi:hypothetical protein